MNTHAVFEFVDTSDTPIDKLAFRLVSEIADLLRAKGVKCQKVTPGWGCPGFRCELGKTQLSVGVYEFRLRSVDPLKISAITCGNDFPFWKHLFHRYTSDEFYLGEPLKQLVGMVQEFVSQDSRFVNVRWMNDEECQVSFFGSPPSKENK